MVVNTVIEAQADKLRRLETWLARLGEGSPRFAVLIDFVPVSLGKSGMTHAIGDAFEAELAFFPSAAPLRAVIAAQTGPTMSGGPSPRPSDDVAGAVARLNTTLAARPWSGDMPFAARGARVVASGASLWLTDGAGTISLPLRHDDGELALPLIGLTDIDAFGCWDGHALALGLAEISARPMDRRMSAVDDAALEQLARSFLLGTARNPAPVDAAFKRLAGAAGAPSELGALALLGLRMRFRKPGPPPASSFVAIADPRAIVPDAARPLMRRLVGGKDASANDIAGLALADACHRRRLRPHPFDLPRLSAFVKQHGELLGATASAWMARGEEIPASYFDPDAIDETNWTSARPAARATFIAALRAREPERARALVESSFAADAAPVRARLLAALSHGLCAADAPFLESLAKDRAPSVRDEAQRLLKFIPGTAAAQSRLIDLVARTKVATAGLLRRRKTLALERPANLPASADRGWAAAEYAGVALDEMAAAFALPVSELIAAAADDAALTALFARQASIERRFDLLATIVREQTADAWIDAVGSGEVELPDDATIEQWCAAALAPGIGLRCRTPRSSSGFTVSCAGRCRCRRHASCCSRGRLRHSTARPGRPTCAAGPVLPSAHSCRPHCAPSCVPRSAPCHPKKRRARRCCSIA